MEFKVGDKVKLVRLDGENPRYKKYLGKILTVSSVHFTYVDVKEGLEYGIRPYKINLELVSYEDLDKAPIGTKLNFENGYIIKVTDKRNYGYSNGIYYNATLDNTIALLKNNMKNSYFGKLISIEEPNYTTTYEADKEILDEVEKRYLRGVIRPFKEKVKTIRKTDNKMNSKDNQYITITFKDDFNMDFPNFEPNTMYKGMEEYKEYTLEELGL